MQPTSAIELAQLAGAELIGPPQPLVGPAVVIDSRQASPGCLFVALPGERVDGHDFAADAVRDGAAAVLCARDLGLSVPQLVVADTAEAMARLAAAVVARGVAAGLVSIGVTGSSGKTSTKDLIAQVLASAGATVAPIGSANNEIGVPLTALRLDAGTRFLVSELGARGAGHIRWLCDIVEPSVGVVTNVGHAHVGEFGSVDAIAAAKAELVEALPDRGWAVLNADDQRVAAMAGRTAAQLAGFSVVAEPGFGAIRVWAEDIALDQRQRPGFTLCARGSVNGSAPVTLQVSGVHQVANAVAAAAVGLAHQMSLAEVARALSGAVAQSRWRMELLDRADGLLVVNDAYNANPDSMAAALHAAAGMRRPGGRLIAVLGDMLELGPQSEAEHRRVGETVAALGFDELVAVGAFAESMAQAARAGGVEADVVDTGAAAYAAINGRTRGADVVLVKASRGLALESVAQRLAEGMAMESE